MALPPHGKEKKKPSHERWLVSYADLMTLLLALFVVLYATSTQNKVKIQQAAESFITAFHGTPLSVIQTQAGSRGVMQHQPSPIPRPVEHPAPRRTPAPPAVSRQLQQEMKELQAVQQLL